MAYPWTSLRRHLTSNYGGKRALVSLGWHGARACLGLLGRYKKIDWRKVSRVVFVCKGNICRSAFASSRFRTFGIPSVSAGLEADSGQPADPMAIRVAKHFGTNLLTHRSLHISQLELRRGDLLVAFEPGHAEQLQPWANQHPDMQVTLLGFWSPLPGMAYLHDPYGLPEAYFQTCFARIERGLVGLSRHCFLPPRTLEKMP